MKQTAAWEFYRCHPWGRPGDEAIAIPWADMHDLIGKKHEGCQEDDELVVNWLIENGAPDWVKDADGEPDPDHWLIVE